LVEKDENKKALFENALDNMLKPNLKRTNNSFDMSNTQKRHVKFEDEWRR
jgi:hypothetical protein